MNEAGKGIKESEYTSNGPVGVGSTLHTVGYAGKRKTEYDEEVIEFVQNKKAVYRVVGASAYKQTSTWTFEPTAKGTKLTNHMDYELPYSVLGKLADKLTIHKEFEKEVTKLFENIKKGIEAQLDP